MILVACGLFVSANGTPFAGENSGSESAEQLSLLEEKLSGIGYHIDYGCGDYNGFEKLRYV